MKKIISIFIIIIGFSSYAQYNAKNFRTKLIQVVSDTIHIDSVSISPFNFKVRQQNKKEIDTSEYKVNFETAQLIIDKNKFSIVIIEYNALPEFLTKVYSRFNKILSYQKLQIFQGYLVFSKKLKIKFLNLLTGYRQVEVYQEVLQLGIIKMLF